jgi:N-acetylglucosamine-6-phosphate deacetylase
LTQRVIIRGRLLWPDGRLADGVVTVAGNQIQSVEEGPPATVTGDDRLIDLADAMVLAPGFIDLHFNGAFGHDFTNQPRQIAAVAHHLPRFGVTSFLPTLVSAPLERYTAAIQAARDVTYSPGAAIMLGLHFQGPYLNPAKAGAHVTQFLRRPSADEIRYIDPEVVRLVTLAPELPGALPFIRKLAGSGICVGLSHSVASYEQTLAAVEAGASWGAHLFNSMGALHHRHPGIVGALLADERLSLALIADGVHVHPAVLRLAVAAKGAHQVTLVSAAMAATAMNDGRYFLGDQEVFVTANTIRLANGSLAGSRSMLDQAVRTMVQLAGRPLAEALQMTSATPARVIGATRKGRIIPGYDADLIILDHDLQVVFTMVQGHIGYQKL